jgi:dihydroflavonol-4-reductase
MRVLVTGGTGFIGSHAVAAFLAAGHEVRLLARRPERVDEVLGPRGIVVDDVVQGDMAAPDAVARALEGCDAVLHAAAAVAVASGDLSTVSGNEAGTRTVIDAAVAAGCDPVLYTSSVAVLYPPRDLVLTAASPLGEPISEYGRSKVACEHYVRELQAEGAPVTSLLIGGVYGPDQPQLDSAMYSIVAAASQAMVVTRGGVGVLDVRDLAQVLTASLEAGRGPRRYLVGGRFQDWSTWTDLLSEVLGRSVRRVRVPGRLMTGLGRTLDVLQRVRDFDYPLTYEAALYMTSAVPTDDSSTLTDLGVSYRPTSETLADATRWLVEAGHLEARHAPALAGDRPV